MALYPLMPDRMKVDRSLDDDLTITMEYHMSSVAVVITGYGFGVAPVKMDIWREICSKVDSVDFYPTTDDEVRIILAIENVFVPA